MKRATVILLALVVWALATALLVQRKARADDDTTTMGLLTGDRLETAVRDRCAQGCVVMGIAEMAIFRVQFDRVVREFSELRVKQALAEAEGTCMVKGEWSPETWGGPAK